GCPDLRGSAPAGRGAGQRPGGRRRQPRPSGGADGAGAGGQSSAGHPRRRLRTHGGRARPGPPDCCGDRRDAPGCGRGRRGGGGRRAHSRCAPAGVGTGGRGLHRMSAALRRRNALCLLFLLPGLGISSWVTRTPDIRDLLGASTAQMGFILFGLSVGSMVGILASGALVARWGTRRVILLGVLLMTAGVTLVALGAAAGTSVLVAGGLALFGLGMGGGEVALNVD